MCGESYVCNFIFVSTTVLLILEKEIMSLFHSYFINWRSQLAGTACFASERIIHALLLGTVGSDNTDSSSDLTDKNDNSTTGNNTLRMVSHVFGGMIGGAVNGSLFQKRPIAGMGLFVPIMVMVALGEDKLNDARRSRIEYLLRQNDENKG